MPGASECLFSPVTHFQIKRFHQMQSCWTVLWAAYVATAVTERGRDGEILGCKEIATAESFSTISLGKMHEW